MRLAGLAASCLLLLSGLTGCISPKPLTRQPSPQAFVLPDVPLERWGDNTCGAGALSSVMRHYGSSVTEEDLVPLLPTGRNGGVVSIDLLIAAKQNGFTGRLLRGDEELLRKSLSENQPVITMIRVVDLPGVSRDLFHYLVIDGYDPERHLYRAQFGDGKARWLSMKTLEPQWSATDYATFLLRPDSEETRTTDNRLLLRKAVQLEDEGRDTEALEIYEAILKSNPDDPLAWINAGNVRRKLGLGEQAEDAYRRALELSPDDRDVMNNLAWLLLEERRNLEEAEFLARRATLQVGPDAFLYFDTLGAVLLARGDCGGAIGELETALFSVPSEQNAFRAPILLNLARAQIECDRRSEARESLRRALETAGDDDPLKAELEATLATLP